jgi:hypothetical protein
VSGNSRSELEADPALRPESYHVSTVDAVVAISVGLSAMALAVAVYGARQAKRSADAARASERHGSRSATAAEQSSAQAQRSADAAERSAAAQEERLEMDRRRVAGERVDAAHDLAPRWEAISEGPNGLFTLRDGVLTGGLRNAGLHGAEVELVVLDLPSGGRLPMQTRREPLRPSPHTWEARPHVAPGGILMLTCEIPGDERRAKRDLRSISTSRHPDWCTSDCWA